MVLLYFILIAICWLIAYLSYTIRIKINQYIVITIYILFLITLMIFTFYGSYSYYAYLSLDLESKEGLFVLFRNGLGSVIFGANIMIFYYVFILKNIIKRKNK